MEEKKVYSSNNAIEVDYICSVLKENNIPYVKKTDGAGDYLNIATGNLLNYTVNILVSQEDYEKADELIKTIQASNEAILEDDLPDELKNIPEKEKNNDNKAKIVNSCLKFFVSLALILPVVIVIIAIIIMNKQ